MMSQTGEKKTAICTSNDAFLMFVEPSLLKIRRVQSIVTVWGLCFDQSLIDSICKRIDMGMRIGGGTAPAPVATQSSVATWQQAQLLKSTPPPAPTPQVSKPTETMGNNVNTFA